MLLLIITGVLSQATQSSPIPQECFTTQTRLAAQTVLERNIVSLRELTELSGPLAGDQVFARSVVQALNTFQANLGQLVAALRLRQIVKNPSTETLIRVAHMAWEFNLRQLEQALGAAEERSTRTSQLKELKFLRESIDFLQATVHCNDRY